MKLCTAVLLAGLLGLANGTANERKQQKKLLCINISNSHGIYDAAKALKLCFHS